MFFFVIFVSERAHSQTASTAQILLAWYHSNTTQDNLGFFKMFYGTTSRFVSPQPETFPYSNQQWIYPIVEVQQNKFTGIISDLALDTRYYIAVSAVSIVNIEGLKSSELSYVTPATATVPLPRVLNFEVTQDPDQGAKFSFDYKGGELNREYRIEGTRDLKSWTSIQTFQVTDVQAEQTFNFSLLPGEPTYFFRIATTVE